MSETVLKLIFDLFTCRLYGRLWEILSLFHVITWYTTTSINPVFAYIHLFHLLFQWVEDRITFTRYNSCKINKTPVKTLLDWIWFLWKYFKPSLTHQPIFRKFNHKYEDDYWDKSNPFQSSVKLHIETNNLICNANQMTGFYIKRNTELKTRLILLVKLINLLEVSQW